MDNIGPGYMNPRKREEVVDRMCETLLAVLSGVEDDDWKVSQSKKVIRQYQRFISYHQKQDQRKERLANAKRAQR